ncbi:glycosyltransferase family 39 protein [Candidatus Roizmanbacteria bacterium]|nr:glycosyltransferase family 39 protein [Candidatus Roizmanbacteria bacterium]
MKKVFWLIIIVLIAALLRFYQLGNIAPSLTWDEVAWGYNAYSLGIDGKDEFGRFLPYDYLESFGDFKPPIYAYLDILPVKMFGLNEFAVRFPSALFGTLTVLITYFLVKKIFDVKREESKSKKLNYSDYLALLSAFILAISPWHIMLSRAAFEANIATFLLSLGGWLFLDAIKGRPWSMLLSAVAFVLSMYTFNTARIVAPLLVIILVIAYRKQIFKIKKISIISCIVGLALLLPVIPFLFSPQAALRFKEVNIFSDIKVIETVNQEVANDQNVWWSKIIHNRRFAYSIEYVKHYFDNLSPLFLFINGDGNPKFSIQSIGQMYIFELPFFIAGILFLFRKKEGSWWLILIWILVGIIPAATARETPHALRIETTLPMFQVIVAYGIVNFYLFLNKNKIFKSLAVLYLLFAVFNVTYFLEDYLVHYPKDYSREWQYGYKNAVIYMNQVGNNYKKIYLSSELGRPYIYTLFYKKYDPALFRKDADIERDAFGFVNVNRFGKYYFNKDIIDKEKDKNILYIDSLGDVPKNAKILKEFKALDGNTVLIAYTL